MNAKAEVVSDPFPETKPSRHRFTHLRRDAGQLCDLAQHPDGAEDVIASSEMAKHMPLKDQVCPKCQDLDMKASHAIAKANHYAQLDQDFAEGKIPEYSGHYAEAKARYEARQAAKKNA